MREDNTVKFVSKGQKCPACSNKTFDTFQVPYDIAGFGKSLFFIMRCNSCHYRNTDVISLETKEPVRYKIIIDNEHDMRIRVIKSSSAKLTIPGIIILEGSSLPEGYISNIEGVLLRIIDAINMAKCGVLSKTKNKIVTQHIEKLKNVMEGKGKIELVIEDKSGNSTIISEKAIKKVLNL